MKIKEFSEKAGLSVHTLRYYEKVGLLFNIKRNSSGHRDYTAENLEWIELLKKLKSTGMTLTDMCMFAKLYRIGDKTIPKRRQMLEKHKIKVEADIAELQSCLDRINYKLRRYKKAEKGLT